MSTTAETLTGEQALRHKPHEHFCHEVASGESQAQAYKKLVAKGTRKGSYTSAASTLAARVDVHARILFLREQITAGTISPHSSEESRRKEQALARLRTVYDHKDAKPGDLLKALELEAKLAGWTEENEKRERERVSTPDPVFLREYLAKCEALGLHPLHESERVHGVPQAQSEETTPVVEESDTVEGKGDPPEHPPRM